MEICLLIINYNGLRFLREYLNKIAEESRINQITLLVTDDNSSDESIEYLKNNNVMYTLNSSDKHGFAANVNNGIKYARNLNNFDYFIIANNDIAIRDGFFKSMKDSLQFLRSRDNRIGIVGFDEIEINRFEYFDAFDFNQYTNETTSIRSEVPGFFFIISIELLNTIGYMDEEYFMYGEDNDYFARTLKANYTIYNTFLPVMHYSEGSSIDDKVTSWYVYRNSFLHAQKNMNFTETFKLFASFINIIYNPFYSKNDPSIFRIRRNGFISNNLMLIKSIFWNVKYFFRRKLNERTTI